MLAISAQNQQGIFEKVLRGKDGRLYAVRFTVSEVAGQLHARVISASLVNSLEGECSRSRNTCNLLEGKTVIFDDFLEPPVEKPSSPFVSQLEFLLSQLARAPSVSF